MTAAEPTGDVREQIAHDLAPRVWPFLLERHRDRLRARADEILACPAVRDALAAQETVRRVQALADRLVVIADETEQAVSYTDGEYRADQLGLGMGYRRGGLFIRRALAGDQ